MITSGPNNTEVSGIRYALTITTDKTRQNIVKNHFKTLDQRRKKKKKHRVVISQRSQINEVSLKITLDFCLRELSEPWRREEELN